MYFHDIAGPFELLYMPKGKGAKLIRINLFAFPQVQYRCGKPYEMLAIKSLWIYIRIEGTYIKYVFL